METSEKGSVVEDGEKFLDSNDKTPHRPEDLEAVRDLVLNDSVLRNDPVTGAIIKRKGFTAKGEKVTDFGRFIHARKEELKANPPYGKTGPELTKNNAVTHSDPNEKVE